MNSTTDSLIAGFPNDKSAVLAITELLESGVPCEDVHVNWRETQDAESGSSEHHSLWQRIRHFLESPPEDPSTHTRRVTVTLYRSATEPAALTILRRHLADV